MERSLHRVVSLDDNRIRVSLSENDIVEVTKKTTMCEFQNYLQMREHLKSQCALPLRFSGYEFSVSVTDFVGWNEVSGELTTEYFDGDNLEILLQNITPNSRIKYVQFTHTFLEWLRKSGTIWNDCAPRNILINESTSKICIVDFEKGNLLQEEPYTKPEFTAKLRGIIFEEMSAFLFPDEQKIVFDDLWNDEDNLLPLSVLRGKREPILYRHFFGEIDDQISSQKLMQVQKLMADIVTPYLIDGLPFFPLTLLAKAGSPEKYTSLLLELTKVDKAKWPDYITNSIKT